MHLTGFERFHRSHLTDTGHFTRSLRAGVVVVTLAVLCLASFVAPGRASLGTVNDYEAQIASTGKQIWLVKQGVRASGRAETRVFRFAGGKWKPLPGALANRGGRLHLTIRRVGRGSVPCVGYMAPGSGDSLRAVVKCFQQRRWRDVGMADAFRGMYMAGLDARGRHLVALLVDNQGRRSKAHVLTAANNRFARLGRPMTVPRGGISFTLGSGTRSAPARLIDVAALYGQARVDLRWVATMNWGWWQGVRRLSNLESGPVATGPVRTRRDLFLPVTEAPPDGSSWKFSVLKARGKGWVRVGGGLLNQSEHIARGGLGFYPVGNRIWASWTEMQEFEPGGTKQATIDFIAPLMNGRFKAKKVWRGEHRGTPLQGVAVHRGRIAALFMRAESDSYDQHATVRFFK
jgi:hypothetical protein